MFPTGLRGRQPGNVRDRLHTPFAHGRVVAASCRPAPKPVEAGMRIVHTVPHVCKEASGPSYSVSRLCEELGAKQHRVRLLTIDKRARRDAQSYRHQACGSSPLFPRLGMSRELEASLARQAKRADVIHNHGLWMMPNVYSGTAAKTSGTPLIVSPRGTFSPVALARSRRLKKTFWWLKQRAAVEQAKCLHATCEQEYHDIRAHGLEQPVAIIPNGVDVPAPRPNVECPPATHGVVPGPHSSDQGAA